MNIVKRSIGLVGILAMGVWPVLAAPVGSSQVSLNAGAAIPTWANTLDNTQSVGPSAGARYLYQLTSNFSVGGQFDFVHLPGKTQGGDILDVNAVDNIYTGELVGRYSFMADAKWAPYVHAGIGVARIFETTKGTPSNGASWNDTGTSETRVTDHESSTNFALSYGGGVERMLSDRLLCALEATWNTLGASSSRIGTSTVNFPVLTLRLGWQFGGK